MKKNFIFLTLLYLIGSCSTENRAYQTKNFSTNGLTKLSLAERYDLPKTLQESSGLAWLNDTLWTLNDSGNEPRLYALDLRGNLLDSRTTANTNIDWEDMTVAHGNLIVADMGNNYGTRKNLYLLEIQLSNGHTNTLDSIPFYYPEQENFNTQQATPFDAEGIIFIDDQLVVFTKNRSTLTTEIYLVSKATEAAEKIGSLDVGSLITGADYQEQSKTLALTGYEKNGKQYLYVVNDFSLSKLSSVDIQQYKLDLDKAQVEGVSIVDNKTFWITSESEEISEYRPFLAKVVLPQVQMSKRTFP